MRDGFHPHFIQCNAPSHYPTHTIGGFSKAAFVHLFQIIIGVLCPEQFSSVALLQTHTQSDHPYRPKLSSTATQSNSSSSSSISHAAQTEVATFSCASINEVSSKFAGSAKSRKKSENGGPMSPAPPNSTLEKSSDSQHRSRIDDDLSRIGSASEIQNNRSMSDSLWTWNKYVFAECLQCGDNKTNT